MDFPMVYTQYVRPSEEVCPLEHHADEGKVETAGYVPADILIERLISAGERLQVSRDYEFGPDEEVPDAAPAAHPVAGVDALRAAYTLNRSVNDRIAAAQAELKAAEAAAAASAKAAEKSSEPVSGAS